MWTFQFRDLDLNSRQKLQYGIDEWKNFGIVLGKEEKTAITKTWNAQFTFIGSDAQYLKDIVLNRGFSARIAIEVYKDSTLFYVGRLQLDECEFSGNTFQCPIYEGGLFALLDSAWNTEQEITAGESMRYTGGTYDYSVTARYCQNTDVDVQIYTIGAGTQSNYITFLPITYERQVEKIGFKNSSMKKVANTADVSRDVCFFTRETKTIFPKARWGFEFHNVKIEFSQTIDPYTILGIDRVQLTTNLNLYIYKIDGNTWMPSANLMTPVNTKTLSNATLTGVQTGSKEFVIEKIDFQMFDEDFSSWVLDNAQEYGIAIGMNIADDVRLWSSLGGTSYQRILTGATIMQSEWNARYTLNLHFPKMRINEFSRKIKAISVRNMFSSLIAKLSNAYKIDMNLNDLPDNIMLINSQFAKNSGKIRTTIAQLIDFARIVLGLKLFMEYDIDRDRYTITFIPIADTFSNDVMSIKTFSNMRFSAHSQSLYTQVVAGYSNIQDAYLGELEFNTKNTFSTNLNECNENKKEFLSPYTAGNFDIETIIANHADSTDDTDSGSDVICVLQTESGANKLYQVGNDRYCNVLLTPARLLLLHAREIYGATLLRFTSSARKAEFEYEGLAENANIRVHGQYCKPIVVSFETPMKAEQWEQIRRNPFNVIEVSGVRGYIAEGTTSIEYSPMAEKETNISIILANE